jgi:predicted ATPase
MRIAVSGSHGTGKSTLITELAAVLPGMIAIDEAYDVMLSDGAAFGERLRVDDFDALCERAVELVEGTDGELVVFDRSPADYLAYMVALDADAPSRKLIADVGEAMESIDLVIFVPIEEPDRVRVTPELPRLRKRVNALLREMLIEDSWGWGVPVLEVRGAMEDRVRQVVAHIATIS